MSHPNCAAGAFKKENKTRASLVMSPIPMLVELRNQAVKIINTYRSRFSCVHQYPATVQPLPRGTTTFCNKHSYVCTSTPLGAGGWVEINAKEDMAYTGSSRMQECCTLDNNDDAKNCTHKGESRGMKAGKASTKKAHRARGAATMRPVSQVCRMLLQEI